MQEDKTEPSLTPLDEELYRLIGDITEVPYLALPLEQPQIIFIAGSIERLIGYSAAQIYADSQLWISIIHPDDRERVVAAFAKFKNRGGGFEIEYRITRKDGSVLHVIDKGEPVLNDKGHIVQIDGLITDVSEQKRAEGVQLSEATPKATAP